jgi:hypothetical protein
MDLLAKSALLFFGSFPDYTTNRNSRNDHSCNYNSDHNVKIEPDMTLWDGTETSLMTLLEKQ